jgi:hypothetical protein
MPFGTNCYLVASEQTRDGMVVDPAANAPRILGNIREQPLAKSQNILEPALLSIQPSPKSCSVMTSANSIS